MNRLLGKRLALSLTLGLLLASGTLSATPGPRILLVARDLDDRPLAGLRFAYAGVTSRSTNQAGATDLDLPPGHVPGQQIKVQLLAGSNQADEWFLIAPQINIPIATVPAEIVLMRRILFRRIAAVTRAGLAAEENQRTLLRTAAQHGLSMAQLETAIRSFAETQDPKDRGIAVFLEHRYQESEELLGQAVAKKEADLVDALHFLGEAQFQQAKYAAAETSFRKALALNVDDPVLLGELGFVLAGLGRWSESESLMRRSLDIDQKTLDPTAPRIARDLTSLAYPLGAMNRPAEAESLLRRALDIDQKVFGPQSPEVASDLNDLAQILDHTNRQAEAELLMRRTLDIDEAHYGPLDPVVARDLNNLATLLLRTSRSAEAEPLMRRALDIDEKKFGADDPRVATFLNNLAEILKGAGHLTEVEALLRRALDIDQASFGPLHPNVARDLNNLARRLIETNRSAEAEPLMHRALDIAEKSYGPRHSKVAACLEGLAKLFLRTNRSAEAEPLIRRALDINEETFGLQDARVALDLDGLAGLLQETNRLAEAEPVEHRAVSILLGFEHRTGHKHPKWVVVSDRYRAILRAMGRSEAELDAAIGTPDRPLRGEELLEKPR